MTIEDKKNPDLTIVFTSDETINSQGFEMRFEFISRFYQMRRCRLDVHCALQDPIVSVPTPQDVATTGNASPASAFATLIIEDQFASTVRQELWSILAFVATDEFCI